LTTPNDKSEVETRLPWKDVTFDMPPGYQYELNIPGIGHASLSLWCGQWRIAYVSDHRDGGDENYRVYDWIEPTKDEVEKKFINHIEVMNSKYNKAFEWLSLEKS